MRPCIHPGAATEQGCFPGIATQCEMPEDSAIMARRCVRMCARAGNPVQSPQAAQLSIPWADAHGYILSPLRGWMAKHAALGAAKPGPVIIILAA